MTASLNVLYKDGSDAAEVSNTKPPKCCGETMMVGMDTGKFLEVVCTHCGDVVYLKKDTAQKPQMIDD